MRKYQSLAWRELRAQKVMSVLILTAVILSTMMTAAVGQSIGILQSMREQQAGMLNGYRYGTFHGLDDRQLTALKSDPRLSWTGSNIALGTSKMQNSGLALQLREYDEKGLEAYPEQYRLKAGRLPAGPGEIALSEETLKLLGVSGQLGDRIQLVLNIVLLQDSQAAHQYQAGFVLTGILENNYLAYSSGTVSGIAGRGSAAEFLPERYQVHSADFITADKSGFQQTVDQLASELGVEKEKIQYNWVYLSALGISFDQAGEEDGALSSEGFSYMTMACILTGALVLLAAGLVIYNILKIAVGTRIKEYGCLRAMGAEPGQLYGLVLRQLVLLCGIGIPIGAVLGVLSSAGITDAAMGLFNPDVFMAGSRDELSALVEQNSSGKLGPLLISAAITLLFALLASMPAARFAARVSPIIAMGSAGAGKGPGRKIGAGRAGIRHSRRKNKKIRSFERYFAWLNLKRHPARSLITILSLVMSITVFVALNAFAGLLDTSEKVQKLHLGDFAVTSEAGGFRPDAVRKFEAREDVASLSTLKYSLYSQGSDGRLEPRLDIDFELKQLSETVQIIGLDAERLKALCPEVTEEQKNALADGTACLVKNPISFAVDGEAQEGTAFSPGDQLRAGGRELEVAGLSEPVTLAGQGFINGVQIIVVDSLYDELTGREGYAEFYPTLKEGADRDRVEQAIQEICDQTPDGRWISYQNTDRQLAESFGQIRLLAYGLILFIGLIGLLNIVNTTYTNIHARIGEIGVQRAIGMSRAGLYQTFLWEGAYYGMVASGVGALTGYLCTVFIEAGATSQLVLTSFPVTAVLQATVVSIAACLLATCIPLHRIARMDIVEAIDNVE